MAAGKFNMRKASGGVASITVADGVGATNIVLPESGTVATTSNIVGFKNYIINGGFNVNQYPAFSNSSDGYKFDRWGISAGTNINTMSQVQLNSESSSNKALSFTKTSNPTSWIWTKIEFPRILAGKTVTLSFRAYSNTGYNMQAEVYFDKYNPTDGFTNATTAQTFTWNNSWSKRTMTFTLPALGTNFNNGNSCFQLNFSMTGTTTGAYLTDVQLEEGSVATPFENRPYGLELSLCQRYYEVLGVGVGQAKDATQMILQFSSSPKRVPATAMLLTSTPYGESPINITARVGVSSFIVAHMNQISWSGSGHILGVQNFSGMVAGSSASINAGQIALSAEL